MCIALGDRHLVGKLALIVIGQRAVEPGAKAIIVDLAGQPPHRVIVEGAAERSRAHRGGDVMGFGARAV